MPSNVLMNQVAFKDCPPIVPISIGSSFPSPRILLVLNISIVSDLSPVTP